LGARAARGAHPLNQGWVESIRDQCARRDVPFFFKQWGGVRKGEAGRDLDGRSHDDMPSVSAQRPPDELEHQRRLERAIRLGGNFKGHVVAPLLRVRS